MSNFAIPPSGVILQGYGLGVVFPSSDGNWLFRQHGDWLKYTETRAIAGPDALNLSLVQRVSSTQLDFPTGAGLQVAPSSGGVYIIGGERIDLSTAATVYAGVMAPTFAPSTTNYVHARLMPNTGGPVTIGSVGEILVSTNGSEAGYSRILEVTTDATDITGTAEPIALSIGYEWATKITFADMAVTLLTFERAVGLGSSGNDTLILQCAAADTALSVVVSGTGKGINVTGGSGDSAIEATAGPGQIAGDFIADATSVHALRAIGGTLRAVYGVGQGGGRGGEFLAGSTATEALLATGVDADANGVHGRTSTSASATAAGVLGEARGVGTSGLKGDGGTVGRGLVAQADASSPAYSAMRIVPQDADPTSATSDGDTIWHADHRTLRTCVAGYGYRSLLSMGPGSALYQAASQSFNAVHNVGGVYADLLTVSCLEAKGQGFFGTGTCGVLISFSCNVRVPAPPRTIDVNLLVNGVSVAEWVGSGTDADNGFEMGIPTSNWGQPPITFELLYPPTADGDLVVTVQVKSSGAGGNPEIRNAGLRVVGTFESI
jgi:hypothetical protein